MRIHPYPCIRKWVFPGKLCHFLISGGYFTVQGLISYVKFLKYKARFKCKTRFKYKNLGHSPYGPWPIWARAHMGQGPYGPGPIWAPGPWAPGPSLLGKHLTKKRTLEKRVQIVFLCVIWKQKRCATSVRSFWRRYRAEISAMCQKTKVFVFGGLMCFEGLIS